MKKIYLLSLFILVTLLFLPKTTFSCSCVSLSQTDEDSLLSSDVVFMGKVTDITTITRLEYGYDVEINNVKFEVERYWKNGAGKYIDVETSPYPTACGYNFKQDGLYLVFANYYNERLSTGSCSRTSIISNQQKIIESLGEGEVPQADDQVSQKIDDINSKSPIDESKSSIDEKDNNLDINTAELDEIFKEDNIWQSFVFKLKQFFSKLLGLFK